MTRALIAEILARTTDPGTLRDGMLWYRSDLGQMRFRDGSVTKIFGPTVIDIPFFIDARSVAVTGSAVGVARYPIFNAGLILGYRVRSSANPSGSSVVLDFNKNGTTLFTTQGNRPTITTSTSLATKTMPDVTAFADDDQFSVDLDSGTLAVGVVLSGLLRVALTA